MSTDPLVDGKRCTILPVNREGTEFKLLVAEVEIRRGPHPRKLSQWALDAGAREVSWDFDLKLVER